MMGQIRAGAVKERERWASSVVDVGEVFINAKKKVGLSLSAVVVAERP